MTCADVQQQLLDWQRHFLAPEQDAAVRQHVERCPSCARAAEAERLLSEALGTQLPQYPASLALKRRLASAWPARPALRRRAWSPWLAPPAAVTALLLVLALPTLYQGWLRGDRGPASLVQEAANDYVRLVTSQHPLEIASGGLHQVKPWFTGRLDFAPVVKFEGDAEFPLKGGALGYFLDRKAAVFVYGRRLHTIALFVVRADGLPWPTRNLIPLGPVQAYRTRSKGFNVLLWRAGELGYALVSDVDAGDLAILGSKIAGSS